MVEIKGSFGSWLELPRFAFKRSANEAREVGGGKDGALDERQLISLVRIYKLSVRGLNKIGKSY
ncbi:hypothetical protein KY290_006853 [Solanum tuberosum]|uniref:Uncharacterized protein n=1 Tax=Solanum tuberosum TaxID=4113 RepID=A0ABQ7W6H9_SOLTU|nr:hypothetical protein KY284_006892 [Solanum tuberosum]KAH0775442.1 hypothetical protein KY290_006853 [Solanum tuberosum]